MTKKTPHVCIYCGERREMSKEHIIADWVAAALHQQLVDSHGFSGMTIDKSDPKRTLIIPKPPKINQGHLGSRKIRRVCKVCNNGWMKEIQDAAIPLLKPLFDGVWQNLSLDVAKWVSVWVAMTVMNIDAADFDGSGVPQLDRTSLFQRKVVPPSNWQIWMGRRTGGDKIEVNHNPALLTLAGSPIPTDQSRNSQITTVCIGRVVFHAISMPSGFSTIDQVIYGRHLGIIPISPMWGGDVLDWRFAPILTTDAIERLKKEIVLQLIGQPVR